MKRLGIIFVSVLAVIVFGTQVNAQTIDLISQTYHISGQSLGVPLGAPDYFSFNITSSVPPLSAVRGNFPNTRASASADGGSSGSSALVNTSASCDGADCGASADLVFGTTGISYLELSYSFQGTWLPVEICYASFTLSDETTGVTLVSDTNPPFTNVNGGSADGSVEVPVIPSHIYELSAMGDTSVSGSAAVTVTLNAVPEPSAMLLLGFGLIGIAGVRRKFKK
ncbi:MAG: PEP-CTERM sorting domain-containing protein [Syntrophorhabdales bacterium]|jgi:hypothetical protein